MNEQSALNAKTTLEYLVMLNEQSYSQIGRQLHITPQQFSDWIKKRRPIPLERLQALSDFFGVDSQWLVDEKHFAKNLSPLTKIDIEMLLAKNIIAQNEEDVAPYQAKLQRLQQERLTQVRIGRLASLLQQHNPHIDQIIDAVLDQIESGNLHKLSELAHLKFESAGIK